jgi:hypothetical protein
VTDLDDITALDLARWLVDEAPDSPPCDGLDEDGCALEAVAKALWDGGCDHFAGETLLCADHRDELRAAVMSGRLWRCRDCRKFARVVRIEPIR